MNDWGQPGAGRQLEDDLHDLGARVRFPPTPTFAMPVSISAAAPKSSPSWRSTWWRFGLGIAALLVMLLAIPDVRQTAADLAGFPGIRIELGDRDGDPAPTATSIGGALLLGTATDPDTAQAETGLPVMMPGSDWISSPPEVYVNEFEGAATVSLLYPPSDRLPEIGSTGVGLLLMEIGVAGDTRILMTKRAAAESPPQSVIVGDAEGIWIEGGVLTVEGGDPFWTYQRRSGNVLIWEADGVTYRMESSLTRDDAIALAESMQPLGTPEG